MNQPAIRAGWQKINLIVFQTKYGRHVLIYAFNQNVKVIFITATNKSIYNRFYKQTDQNVIFQHNMLKQIE